MQQGDVSLFQTNDGGNILVEEGLVAMSGGLETAAYLSLFGGNEEDDSSANTPFSWWGNIDEEESARQYRSETQNLLHGLPAVSGNLRRIEDAARNDLAWMLEIPIASSVEVEATIPALNTVQIQIDIEANGVQTSFKFTENWQATA